MSVNYDTTEKKYIFDFEHDDAEDIGLAIRNAVDSAHKIINLYHYDIVVMPEKRPADLSIVKRLGGFSCACILPKKSIDI